MIRQRIETPGILGAMTPDDFDRLTDWLLSIPGQVDAPADTRTDLSDVFQRLRMRQEFRQRSEEHTSELQSRGHLVCRLLLEKKKEMKSNKDYTCTTNI